MGNTALREKHKGTSAFGGRYAAHERAESVAVLTEARSNPVQHLSGTDGMTDSQALRTAKFLATRALYKTGLDTDDIAQEALLSVLTSQSRGVVAKVTPGLLALATRNAVAQHLSALTGVRQHDYSARKKLDELVELRTQDLDRELTPVEFEELAEGVRADWHDPRRRPTIGFQEEFTELDLDGAGADAYDLPALVAPDHNTGVRAHDLADDIEAGRVDRTTGRRAAWNAIAADLDLPEVIVGSITESRARNYVKEIGEAPDGALGIAGRYLDGESDNASMTAFFAPFGQIDNRDRLAIAAALTGRPQFADRLWRSALDAANARNNRPAARP